MRVDATDASRMPATRSFSAVPTFYATADALRAEFEAKILGSSELAGGVTPLAYAFFPNNHRFLTATAERMFSHESLVSLTTRLRAWASDVLGVTHATTPQVRVYFVGCSRPLAADRSKAPWHYVLSLTQPSRYPGVLKLEGDKLATPDGRNGFSVTRVIRARLSFNYFVVHRSEMAYAVEPSKQSTNAMNGALLLDGFFW
jgi:hypothetical protein